MYSAIVARIKSVEAIPKSDHISSGNVVGNTVVVSRKILEGDLGVFFETDGQLSVEFATANDLVRYKDPLTGETKGGFFEENRRVRAQKFRGVKSDGFWCPLSNLEFTGADLSKLKEHDKFEVLNGIAICNKYVTQATQRAAGKENKKKQNELMKREILAFPKHFDTDIFRNSVWKLKKGSLVSITEKLHGTSQRFAFVEEKYTYPKWSWGWFSQKIGLRPEKKWGHIVGTRNITLRSIEDSRQSYYGDETFRFKAVKDLEGKLHKYEMLFFEVVGWVKDGTPVMPPGDPKSMKDKQFQRAYGNKMNYSYGCSDGQSDVFVYRIAHLNEDGFCVDLSWEGVKKRCSELGIKHVPEVYDSFIYDGDEDKLRELVESVTDGSSTIDQRHIREGVCIRGEGYPGPYVLKSKSFAFKVMEGMAKDNADYVDLEESH